MLLGFELIRFRHTPADEFPNVAFHVIAGDHPQGAGMDKDAGGMARPPGRIRLLQRPSGAVSGTPNLVAADPGEMHLVPRIPATQQPHPASKRQGPSPVTRSEGGLAVDENPRVLAGRIGCLRAGIVVGLQETNCTRGNDDADPPGHQPCMNAPWSCSTNPAREITRHGRSPGFLGQHDMISHRESRGHVLGVISLAGPACAP